MIDNLMAINHCASSHDSNQNIHNYEVRLAAGETFSPRDLYNYANELLDHEKYEEAITFYQQFLDTKQGGIEENITACGKVADCFLSLNNPEKHLEYTYKSFNYDIPVLIFVVVLVFIIYR